MYIHGRMGHTSLRQCDPHDCKFHSLRPLDWCHVENTARNKGTCQLYQLVKQCTPWTQKVYLGMGFFFEILLFFFSFPGVHQELIRSLIYSLLFSFCFPKYLALGLYDTATWIRILGIRFFEVRPTRSIRLGIPVVFVRILEIWVGCLPHNREYLPRTIKVAWAWMHKPKDYNRYGLPLFATPPTHVPGFFLL